jgi:serine/threonine-protein kinase RsbW
LKSVSVEISSRRENVSKVEEMLLSLADDFNSDKFHNLMVAATELVLNAIVHGNKEDPERFVKVTAEFDNEKIVVKILDEGGGFELNEIPDPTLTGNVLKNSGRGLYIVKKLVDEFECVTTPAGALCTLTIKK